MVENQYAIDFLFHLLARMVILSQKCCDTVNVPLKTGWKPVLEVIPLPAFLINENGVVIQANASGQNLFEERVEGQHIVHFINTDAFDWQDLLQAQLPDCFNVKLASLNEVVGDSQGILIPLAQNSVDAHFLFLLELEISFKPEIGSPLQPALIFQQLVEMAPIMIGIYAEDTIQYVNPTGVQLMGAKSRDDLIGRKILEFIHPDCQELVMRRRKELNFRQVLPPMEERLVRLDGKVIDVEVVSARLPIKGENAFLAVARDITRQKAVERALKESEERYFHLMEISPNAILIISRKQIQYINPAGLQLLGVETVSSLEACPITQFLPELPEVTDSPGETTSRIRSLETQLIQTNGNRLEVDVILTPVIINGQVAEQLIIRNITDRKKYEKNLKDSRDKLRQLSSYLQTIREEERAHIAREIHDELGQMLTGLKLNLAMVERRLRNPSSEILARIKEMTAMVDDTIKVVRRIASELRPEILDDLGLLAAIEWQAQEYGKRSGVRMFLQFEPEDFTVDKQRATTIFRIFQETVTNVMRHAHASEVFITLSRRKEGIELIVEDNGVGIDLQEVEKQQSLGLMGIRERAHAWNGTVEIKGVPGEGTRVRVWIPEEQDG